VKIVYAPKQWWLLTNMGIPRGVYRTRKEAIREAVESFDEPWSKTRRAFKVTKVWLSFTAIKD
jgi:hypothetical protein